MMSVLTDLVVGATVYLLAVGLLDLFPVPNITNALLWAVIWIAALTLAWKFAGATPGALLWRKKPTGAGALIIAFAAALGLFWQNVVQNPYLARLEIWRLTPFAPTETSLKDGMWQTLPFFYTLGAWPRRFQDQPVFYALPYAKGPPRKFVGQVQARWQMPDIHAYISGPWTPTPGVGVDTIKKCLTKGKSPSDGPGCMTIRRAHLVRHFEQSARQMSVGDREIRWFEIENAYLPPEERPQGIYIRTTSGNGERIQERYVVLSPNGAQQSFTLSRPKSPTGEMAQMLFQQSIRSLRVVTGLDPGRAIANRQLSGTALERLNALQSEPERYLSRVAEIQALLISKISVDPKNVEAYYHLAGTSLMLLEFAAQVASNPKRPEGMEFFSRWLEDWTAAARPMVRVAARYLEDVGPGHPLAKRVRGIVIESKKY